MYAMTDYHSTWCNSRSFTSLLTQSRQDDRHLPPTYLFVGRLRRHGPTGLPSCRSPQLVLVLVLFYQAGLVLPLSLLLLLLLSFLIVLSLVFLFGPSVVLFLIIVVLVGLWWVFGFFGTALGSWKWDDGGAVRSWAWEFLNLLDAEDGN